jgi:hypothetical protein
MGPGCFRSLNVRVLWLRASSRQTRDQTTRGFGYHVKLQHLWRDSSVCRLEIMSSRIRVRPYALFGVQGGITCHGVVVLDSGRELPRQRRLSHNCFLDAWCQRSHSAHRGMVQVLCCHRLSSLGVIQVYCGCCACTSSALFALVSTLTHHDEHYDCDQHNGSCGDDDGKR